MKVLVVEDNQERIKWFKMNFTNIDIAEDASTANKLVKDNLYDVIYLDHDLGGETYVNSDNSNTGYQVAKTIRDSQNFEKAEIVVHSLNFQGALNIKSVLTEAKIIPFHILVSSNKNSQN